MHEVVREFIAALRSLSFISVPAFRSAPARTVDQLTRNNCLGHAFPADISVTLRLRGGHARYRAPAGYCHFQTKLIARADRPAKFGTLDSGKHHDLVAPVFDFSQQQCTARLRDGFHNQYSRHDRQTGKVSREEGFVESDVLDGN